MPGTDFMAQAYSGVAGKVAGVGSSRGGSLFTVLDVLGGAVAAQGITIALLNRCMNNAGAKVTSSLMSAATLLCAEDFRDIYSLPASGSKPSSIINEVYATRQGRIAVECPDMDTVLRLAEVLDITAGIENKGFQRCLSEVFPLRTADEWVELFQHAGIPSAVVIEDLAEMQTLTHLQPGLTPGSYTQVNSPWRFK
jgi:crotonobetainyl-CoA:carnitine CoA-transferase CaiB-like acyl-CoA transferase